MRYFLMAAGAALIAVPVAAQDAPDGRVEALNPAVFTAIQITKGRNPGAVNAADARQIVAAIMADGKIDPAERDLLGEYTQQSIRSIRITKWHAPQLTLLVFTAKGDARRIFRNALNPRAD